jgi:hypothetical protein
MYSDDNRDQLVLNAPFTISFGIEVSKEDDFRPDALRCTTGEASVQELRRNATGAGGPG